MLIVLFARLLLTRSIHYYSQATDSLRKLQFRHVLYLELIN
jgi:hypothetical protein